MLIPLNFYWLAVLEIVSDGYDAHYCISGNIGNELNLAVWQSGLEQPN